MSQSIKAYLITIFTAVSLALFVRFFIIAAYRVPTGSMQPTLKPGDFIFAFQKSKFNRYVPQRGDVLVFSYPNQPETKYVKRVLGLPGEQIQIQAQQLFINGQPLKASDLEEVSSNPNPEVFKLRMESFDQNLSWKTLVEKNTSSENFGPLTVPLGELFLIGDNRDVSDDSRYWGTVPISQISGRVVLVWLSLDWSRGTESPSYPVVRWERVFSLVK